MLTVTDRPDDEELGAAWDLVREALSEALPRRWSHSVGVCQAAMTVGPHVTEESSLLERAAMLHDIGYSPQLAATGFHPLDGAVYLQSIGMDDRVVSLVAHHSCAMVEAEIRGLAAELAAFPLEQKELVDALIFCDMTVSPDGQPVTVETRIAEVMARYGENSVVGRFMRRASPALRAATQRVRERLARAAAADCHDRSDGLVAAAHPMDSSQPM